ncbi:hypothetical protein HPB50_025702 [Hyalomma asiaticum]|uniref:Uncharacterized protein n=1 Tax=Hyalomma asiaticum TaxID=266040 RepID=A0ACB7RR14_HYAAI|nr:hypothetical protein HPB50_025702 [Hyalomma asiaticum]
MVALSPLGAYIGKLYGLAASGFPSTSGTLHGAPFFLRRAACGDAEPLELHTWVGERDDDNAAEEENAAHVARISVTANEGLIGQLGWLPGRRAGEEGPFCTDCSHE